MATGGGLGNINPRLYQLAANSTTYASAFHDITTGNNQVPCTTSSPNCPTGSNPVIGYTAGTGYDQATGLGSVDANNLATAFAALVQATGTKTTLTVTPGNFCGDQRDGHLYRYRRAEHSDHSAHRHGYVLL